MNSQNNLKTGTLTPVPARAGRLRRGGWAARRPPSTAKSKPAPMRRSLTRAAVQSLAARLTFCILLGWWLWTDGPQGYMGVGEWVAAITEALGSQQRTTIPVQLVLYLMTTITVNSFWFVLAAWWDWLTDGWGRLLLVGLPLAFFVLLPLTAVDVGKSAAGFYGLFAPLDLDTIHWPLAIASLAESVGGSVVAQVGVMVMVARWRHGGGQKG